jgi:TGS domain.
MSDKIIITFPDGNKKDLKKGVSGFEIAESISKSLAKESIAIKINNEIVDLSRKIEKDSRVQIIKKNDEEALNIIRHDLCSM